VHDTCNKTKPQIAILAMVENTDLIIGVKLEKKQTQIVFI
jgi:hypothetical protein